MLHNAYNLHVQNYFSKKLLKLKDKYQWSSRGVNGWRGVELSYQHLLMLPKKEKESEWQELRPVFPFQLFTLTPIPSDQFRGQVMGQGKWAYSSDHCLPFTNCLIGKVKGWKEIRDGRRNATSWAKGIVPGTRDGSWVCSGLGHKRQSVLTDGGTETEAKEKHHSVRVSNVSAQACWLDS